MAENNQDQRKQSNDNPEKTISDDTNNPFDDQKRKETEDPEIAFKKSSQQQNHSADTGDQQLRTYKCEICNGTFKDEQEIVTHLSGCKTTLKERQNLLDERSRLMAKEQVQSGKITQRSSTRKIRESKGKHKIWILKPLIRMVSGKNSTTGQMIRRYVSESLAGAKKSRLATVANSDARKNQERRLRFFKKYKDTYSYDSADPGTNVDLSSDNGLKNAEEDVTMANSEDNGNKGNGAEGNNLEVTPGTDRTRLDHCGKYMNESSGSSVDSPSIRPGTDADMFSDTGGSRLKNAENGTVANSEDKGNRKNGTDQGKNQEEEEVKPDQVK